MANFNYSQTATLSDFIKMRNENVTPGYTQTDWERFLTGLSDTYSAVGQQVSTQAAYDISDAYANYKQQQLQLQMNQKLGEGFKEQVGSQLQQSYESAYGDIKLQEASNLAKVIESYKTDYETGVEDVAKEAKTLQTIRKELLNVGEMLGAMEGKNIYKPTESEMYDTKEYTDELGNVRTETTLSDIGKLYYRDILTDPDFVATWLDESGNKYTGDLSYEDREALYEYMTANQGLIQNTITGLTEDFDIEAANTKREEMFASKPQMTAKEVKFDTRTDNFKRANSGDKGDNFSVYIGDTRYKVERGSIASAPVQTTLNDRWKEVNNVSNVALGSVLQYQGKLYMFLPNNNTDKEEWVEIAPRLTNDASYKKLMEELGLSYAPNSEQKPQSMNDIIDWGMNYGK